MWAQLAWPLVENVLSGCKRVQSKLFTQDVLADGKGGFGFPEGEEYMFSMLPLFCADHGRRCLKLKQSKNQQKKRQLGVIRYLPQQQKDLIPRRYVVSIIWWLKSTESTVFVPSLHVPLHHFQVAQRGLFLSNHIHIHRNSQVWKHKKII